MDIKKYQENLVINEHDMAIINIAKCYIKHEDKEKALQEIDSLGIHYLDDNDERKKIETKDIDIVINEILNTNLVNKYVQKRRKEIKQLLDYIGESQELEKNMEKVYADHKQLVEIKEALKEICK